MYRKNVAHKRQEVLRFREECDAYTGSTTCENVDHVIEMQIIHYAATDIIDKHPGLANCFAKVVNDVDNLNVTSRRINQSEKSPFTAALNRLRKHEIADCEELARKGRGKWLVEEGIWHNIEKETVTSYEALETILEAQLMTRAHAKALSEATDSIRDTLQNIGFFQ
jgi:hypothetical protein